MSTLRTCFSLLGALLATFSAPSEAWARPPRPHTESVVIESVDHAAHALRLRRGNGCERLTVIWDRRTRFVAEDRLSTASRLQAGGRADVSYRTPFFGERYATKIVLSDSAAPGRAPDPKKCGVFPGGCVARCRVLREALSTSGMNLLPTTNDQKKPS